MPWVVDLRIYPGKPRGPGMFGTAHMALRADGSGRRPAAIPGRLLVTPVRLRRDVHQRGPVKGLPKPIFAGLYQ